MVTVNFLSALSNNFYKSFVNFFYLCVVVIDGVFNDYCFVVVFDGVFNGSCWTDFVLIFDLSSDFNWVLKTVFVEVVCF